MGTMININGYDWWWWNRDDVVDIEIAITSHDNDDRNSNNYDDVDIEIAITSHSIEVDFSMKEKIWLITMGVM
jgi:hypothetical protein